MGLTVNTILLVIVIGFNIAYFAWIQRKLRDIGTIAGVLQKIIKGIEPGVDTYIKLTDDLSQKLTRANENLRDLSKKYATEVERRTKAERIISDAVKSIEDGQREVRKMKTEYITMNDIRKVMPPAERLARLQIERERKKREGAK